METTGINPISRTNFIFSAISEVDGDKFIIRLQRAGRDVTAIMFNTINDKESTLDIGQARGIIRDFIANPKIGVEVKRTFCLI